MKILEKIFNFKNKIVFISGCNGQIGKSLVDLYLQLGAKVYGVDNKKNKLNKKNFLFIEGDICDHDQIKKPFGNLVA